MKDLNKINVKELSLESKILISGGDVGDSAEALGNLLGWAFGTANQVASLVGDVIQSFGVSNPGAGGYTGCKL